MKPKFTLKHPQKRLFEIELSPKHELVRLAELIDWQRLEVEFGEHYCANNGAAAKPIRLMA
nr:hypothetical protein [Pseudoalteromonas rubra]